MRARKSSTILETARDLFLTKGYDGTSLDDVAATSRVSKTTVYNNFADKDALFVAVVTDIIERSDIIADALAADLAADGPVDERLRAAARRLVVSVLDPAVVQLRRLAITESRRFPELIATYWQHAPAKSLATLAAAFTEMDKRGELDIPDAVAAATQFAYAVVGPGQDRALLTPGDQPTERELIAHADLAVGAFLRAYEH
jgi:TetR/AcrR family transcriptional repressor of mexJK operon